MYAKGTLTYQPPPLPDRVQHPDEKAHSDVEAFRDDMKKSHSLRDVPPRPVPEAVITAAIATAGTAPSGANHQPWHFAAIADLAMKAPIRTAAKEEEREF